MSMNLGTPIKNHQAHALCLNTLKTLQLVLKESIQHDHEYILSNPTIIHITMSTVHHVVLASSELIAVLGGRLHLGQNTLTGVI